MLSLWNNHVISFGDITYISKPKDVSWSITNPYSNDPNNPSFRYFVKIRKDEYFSNEFKTLEEAQKDHQELLDRLQNMGLLDL